MPASIDFAAARDEFVRLARKRHYATIASVREAQPQATPMRYAVTDAFEIVLGTLRTSRKYANMQRNPLVAVLIYDDIFALQIEGRMDEPSGPELERLRQVFATEFPLEFRIREGRPNHVFFRLTPAWARHSDFTDEPGRLTTLDFSRGTVTRSAWPAL